MPDRALESEPAKVERVTEQFSQLWSPESRMQWPATQAQGKDTVSLPTLHINDKGLNVYENYHVNSDIAKLYEKNRPAIVRVNTMDPKIDASFSTSAGSGSIIEASGIIATGYHVVKNATALRVKTADGKVYEASILDVDAAKDQALLKLKPNNPFSRFPTVQLATDSSQSQVQKSLVALGFPRNQDAMHVSQLTADRIVSVADLRIDGGLLVGEDKNRKVLRSFGPAQNGNSGGPVFDLKSGEQIGMVNMSDKSDAYITPVEDLHRFMAKTKSTYGINNLPVKTPLERTGSGASPFIPQNNSGLQNLDRVLLR